MKRTFALLLIASILPLHSSFGQPSAQVVTSAKVATESEQPLTKFDLDFHGGTPDELVAAIEKATRKPLNAIVPHEFATVQLPALKMKSVTVPQLFDALQMASQKYVQTPASGMPGGYQTTFTTYGFRTPKPPAENPIWYFFREGPSTPPTLPNSCRFWNLAPYLETYKIDDITTAIQTGWKMLGEISTPTMNFHKDTKLLIAVGDQGKLSLIDSVLQQLAQEKKPKAQAPIKAGDPVKP